MANRRPQLPSSEQGTYQGPWDGFRGDVTRAALRVLTDYVASSTRGHCPSCGEALADTRPQALADHAIDCDELRADVATDL